MYAIKNFVCLLLLCPVPSMGQQRILTREEGMRVSQLEMNRRKLSFNLTSDYPEVLPGEDFCVNYSIRNDSGTMEVFDPFRSPRSGFDLYAVLGGRLKMLTPDPVGSNGDDPRNPTVWIAANQLITRRFCVIDEDKDESGFLFLAGEPGRYRLEYGYSGTFVEFNVPAISLVRMSRARLPTVNRTIRCRCPSDGKVVPFDGELRVAVVATQSEYFLVAGRFTAPGSMTFPDHGAADGVLKSAGMFPFVRIARSLSAILDVAITAENEEKSEIKWSSGGKHFNRALSRTKRPVESEIPR